MITRETISNNLGNCLSDTSFLSLPGRRKGKVRDSYDLGDRILLITTDRQSAFDRILASIPFKGQVLNLVSDFWCEATTDIVANHIVSIPDPNVTIAKKCSVIPVEFVVRGYLTGSTDTSSWTLYRQGIRTICGNSLPDGMVKNQKFDVPLITPTTKSEVHDESISAEEIVSRGIMNEATWKKCASIVLSLFERGTRVAAENGLILVDTKYELGIDERGTVTLIDEVHTPDSSRYWIEATYRERLEKNQEPENIDKEFLRLWFRDHCDPYNDPSLPEAPPELVIELAYRYIRLYEMITGREFGIDTSEPVAERIRRNLTRAGIKA